PVIFTRDYRPDHRVERRVKEVAEQVVDHEKDHQRDRDLRHIEPGDRDGAGGQGAERHAGDNPDHILSQPDQSDADHLAQHQFERLDRRQQDFDDARLLLLHHAAHDGHPVNQHRDVNEHHQYEGHQDAPALAFATLVDDREFNAPRQVADPLGV